MGLLLVPVAAFIALVAAFAVVLRRAGQIVARTRRLDAFRTSLRDLTQRIDASLDGTLERIDALRRQQVGRGYRPRHDRDIRGRRRPLCGRGAGPRRAR
ncbi:MAG: DUF948 domain-containing protein [Candidatus Limnocylindrales bacterium]